MDLFSGEEGDDDVIIGSPAHNILVVEAFAKFLLSLVGDTSTFLRLDEDGKHSFDVIIVVVDVAVVVVVAIAALLMLL